jgi:hypothetical protein
VLDPRILGVRSEHEANLKHALDPTLKARIEALETQVLREALDRHRWNKSQAAAELGLSRVGLSAKIERYGLARQSGDAGAIRPKPRPVRYASFIGLAWPRRQQVMPGAACR